MTRQLRSFPTFMAILLLLSLSMLPRGEAFWFELGASQEKCFFEDMVGEDLIAADTDGDFDFSIRVRDGNGNVVWATDTGRQASFGINVDSAGRYTICFRDLSRVGGLVEFDLDTGATVADYSDIAKRDHLEPLALSLRKSLDAARSINTKLDKIDERREHHEDTSHNTQSALALTSSITVGVVVLLGIVQIYALRSFLRKKKVID